jgi:hypothetical protein
MYVFIVGMSTSRTADVPSQGYGTLAAGNRVKRLLSVKLASSDMYFPVR